MARLQISCWLFLCAGFASAQEVGRLLAAGDNAMLNSQYTSAISQYTAALAIDAASALIYNKRAAAYSAQGQHQKAMRDYEQAVKLEPSAAGALLNRAKLHRSLCNVDAADADLIQILEKKPSHKGATSEQGKVALARALLAQTRQPGHQQEQRRKLLMQLSEVSPHCPMGKVMEAEILLSQNDYGGVVVLTGQVLKLDAANVAALLLRGKAYSHLGDLEVAKRHFSEALRSDPDDKAAKALFKDVKKLQRHKAQAEAAAQTGDHKVAKTEFKEALSMEPGSQLVRSALWLGLCRAEMSLKDGEGAVEACTKAHEAAPDDLQPLIAKVRALVMIKDFGAAVREAGAGKERFRNSQELHQVLQEARHAQKLAERKQYYDILGVGQDAGDAEIKRTYRELARKYHPDKANSEGITVEAAHERFTEISEAYEVLSDPERRMAYDRGDDLHDGQAGYHGGGFPGGFGGFPGGQQYTFRFG